LYLILFKVSQLDISRNTQSIHFWFFPFAFRLVGHLIISISQSPSLGGFKIIQVHFNQPHALVHPVFATNPFGCHNIIQNPPIWFRHAHMDCQIRLSERGVHLSCDSNSTSYILDFFPIHRICHPSPNLP